MSAQEIDEGTAGTTGRIWREDPYMFQSRVTAYKRPAGNGFHMM